MRLQRSMSCIFVAVMITAAPFPAAAQGPLLVPEVETLSAVGTWLSGAIASYVGGKMVDPFFDKILGRDNEKKLKAVETRLQQQLDQGVANRKEVESQLAIAKSELLALQQLMAKVPDRKKLERSNEILKGDLKKVRSMLAEHEKRLAEHDQRLADQGKLIEDQGKQLEDQEHELNALKQKMASSQAPPAPLRWTTPAGSGPAAPPPRPYQAGGSLMIEVRGRANLIRLREATHPVATGIFRLSRDETTAAYYLPPATHTVIELFAPGNRISMPARLAQQVQIISHGYRYDTLTY